MGVALVDFVMELGRLIIGAVSIIIAVIIGLILKFDENSGKKLARETDLKRKQQGAKVDVNWSTVDELASLPGMNLFKAWKADKYRQNKRFDSLAEFVVCVELPKGYVTAFAEKATVNARRPNLGGRVVDL